MESFIDINYLYFQCLIVDRTPNNRLRGKVVLKGRRPVGATDDYDTDSDEADDDLTELQSIWSEKTTVTVSSQQNKHYSYIHD